MKVREIMTTGVVTAAEDEEVLAVAELMRDRRVGSVVLTGPGGSAVAIVTDRDLALRVVAEQASDRDPVGEHATRPLIAGEPEMELSEAAALMVRHRVRRLPVLEGDELAGIVTLDDIAVRTGDLELAKQMTADVLQGALPTFYFNDRRG